LRSRNLICAAIPTCVCSAGGGTGRFTRARSRQRAGHDSAARLALVEQLPVRGQQVRAPPLLLWFCCRRGAVPHYDTRQCRDCVTPVCVTFSRIRQSMECHGHASFRCFPSSSSSWIKPIPFAKDARAPLGRVHLARENSASHALPIQGHATSPPLAKFYLTFVGATIFEGQTSSSVCRSHQRHTNLRAKRHWRPPPCARTPYTPPHTVSHRPLHAPLHPTLCPLLS